MISFSLADMVLAVIDAKIPADEYILTMHISPALKETELRANCYIPNR